MRAVVQRVARARFTLGAEEVLRMAAGLLVFVGVGRRDERAAADELARSGWWWSAAASGRAWTSSW